MKLYRVNRSPGNPGSSGHRHGWRPRTRAARGSASEADGIRNRVLAVLSAHRPGVDGWCEGCAREGVVTFHPCPSAHWAGTLASRYGLGSVREGE